MNRTRARGAALLALLAMVMIVVSVSFVASVSLNKQRTEKSSRNLSQLHAAKEALLGYALRQSAPGLLPCPDANGDGFANPGGSSCSRQLGYLPYKTLQLDDLRDGSGAKLWYAVELSYAVETPGTELNPSLASSLRLNTSEVVAAVVLAPGPPIGNQQRTNNNADRYLEGVNANGTTTTYALAKDETNNDELLGIDAGEFWTTIERYVLYSLGQRLIAYRDTPNCDEYPWAAQNTAPYNSDAGREAGQLPSGNAIPFNGAAGCPGTIGAPAWYTTHWVNEIHYVFCGPSGSDCLDISGDVNQTANALLVSSGALLAGQSRPSAALSNYFETDNNDSDQQFTYRNPRNHSETFNDVVYIFSP